ncbi:MAG: hypothetical protein AAGD25_17240 [Cyanobacteria bacterium P01_F01_bin.150]
MSGWAYYAYRTPSSGWILSGIGVSAIAVIVLAIKWTFHPSSSPDAIYHLVQMLALYCFFQGSQQLSDRQFGNNQFGSRWIKDTDG